MRYRYEDGIRQWYDNTGPAVESNLQPDLPDFNKNKLTDLPTVPFDKINPLLQSLEKCAAIESIYCSDISARLQVILQHFHRKEIVLAFGGHFKSGKSTIINALLRRMVLPTDSLPETGVACFISSGEQDQAVKVHSEAGTYPIDCRIEAIREVVSLISSTGERRTDMVNQIDRLEITLRDCPIPKGVIWIDSPGINDTQEMDKCAEHAAFTADVLLWVLSSNQCLSVPEIKFLTTYIKECGPASVIFLLNIFLEYDSQEKWNLFLNDKFPTLLNKVQDHSLDMGFTDAVLPIVIPVSGRALYESNSNGFDGFDGFGGDKLRCFLMSRYLTEWPRIQWAKLHHLITNLHKMARGDSARASAEKNQSVSIVKSLSDNGNYMQTQIERLKATVDTTLNFAAKVKKNRQNLLDKVVKAIEDMIHIAGEMEWEESARSLTGVKNYLVSNNFQVIILGLSLTGKSTLMNALLTSPTNPVPGLPKGQGPMPTRTWPATAVLTSIRYSEKPYVKGWNFDGKYEEWSMEKYHKESTVRDGEEETYKFFQNICGFEVGYPSELCKTGVTLIDSPGINEVPYRTEVTRYVLRRCEAAIMVYRSDLFAGEDERSFASEVLLSGTLLFTVINIRDGYFNDRFKAFAWNRLVKELQNGPKYDGQDFSSQDIYFIDVYKAWLGKLNGDVRLMAESGLTRFEQALGDFLVKERYKTRLEKFVWTADLCAVDMENRIAQYCSALKKDEEQLFLAYESLKPRLEVLHVRRDKLSNIFVRNQQECQKELNTSLELMIAGLRQDLPKEFTSRKLTSHQGLPYLLAAGLPSLFLITSFQKKIGEEVLTIFREIISSRINTWANNTQKLLEQTLAKLIKEISEEVAHIENDIRFFDDLTDYFSASMSLVMPLVLIPPVIIPSSFLIGSMIKKPFEFENMVKEKILTAILKELQDTPKKAGKFIDSEIAKKFGLFKDKVNKEALLMIDREEQDIQSHMEMNRRSREAKLKYFANLAKASQQVSAQRNILKDVMESCKVLF